MSLKRMPLWLLVNAFLILVGCAAHNRSGLQAADVTGLNRSHGTVANVLDIGDELTIKFYYDSKLNDEVAIRPDGKISLQLIGDIVAAGLTPQDLAARINEEYAKAFKTSTVNYNLGVGDHISIKFYFHRELNEDLVIRPDGKISLQLSGEIQAAGLTPGQLTKEITEIFSKLIDNPQASIIVREFKLPSATVAVKKIASRKVFVGGEVAKPGLLPIDGLLRVYDAIVQSGGALNTAELDSIVLLRYNGTSNPLVYQLDLNRVLSGELPDVLLKPYDVVYVPKSTIAKVDLFVEQHLNQMIPRSVSFPFTYNINPQVEIKRD